jgi:hypothetical protein
MITKTAFCNNGVEDTAALTLAEHHGTNAT